MRTTTRPRRESSSRLRRSAHLAVRVVTAPGRILLYRRRPTKREETAATHTENTHTAPQPLLTGETSLQRRLGFLLVNACTLSSLALGMTAILLATHGHQQSAALLLLACVAFDGLDGALARKFGVSTPFGEQMDSLADMCSFGIATPIVAYAWMEGAVPAWIALPACVLVGACAAIRLARFNVSPKSSEYFDGVPTTMAAAMIALTTLLVPSPPNAAPAVFFAVLALLMVSSLPYVKFGQLLQLPVWAWLAPLALALMSLALAFSAIVGAYLASGVVIRVLRPH